MKNKFCSFREYQLCTLNRKMPFFYIHCYLTIVILNCQQTHSFQKLILQKQLRITPLSLITYLYSILFNVDI